MSGRERIHGTDKRIQLVVSHLIDMVQKADDDLGVCRECAARMLISQLAHLLTKDCSHDDALVEVMGLLELVSISAGIAVEFRHADADGNLVVMQ